MRKVGAGPQSIQTPNVSAAIASTTGTKTAPTRPRQALDRRLRACASSTSRTIWASTVSRPTARWPGR